jgi:hypothetical protein
MAMMTTHKVVVSILLEIIVEADVSKEEIERIAEAVVGDISIEGDNVCIKEVRKFSSIIG